jgi:5-methylthioribose kinase
MLELDATTAADYLRRAGHLAASEQVQVEELAGGVSNIVLRVRRAHGEDFLLKQARGKLRVEHDWFCSIERIWREVEVLQLCGKLLTNLATENAPSSFSFAARPTVPQVLFEDRENYCFAMTSAPRESRTWKELLLDGELPLSRGVATACGELLAALHGGSWNDAAIAQQLDDRTYFDELRIDPYYRQVARVHRDLKGHIDDLIESVWRNRLALVHGDFSPKNLLVSRAEVMLIDFEVGHFGDPAFGLGFFLTHLVLKAIWFGSRHEAFLQLAQMFWSTYRLRLAQAASAVDSAMLSDLESRTMLNLAGCLLARVDGKSPVDYLSLAQQVQVRELARGLLLAPPANWEQAALRIRIVPSPRET